MPRVHHMAFSRVVLLGVLEEVRPLTWLRSMALCWTSGTCPIPTPKQGSRSCCHPQTVSCLQGLCGVWQSLQLSETWGQTRGLYDWEIWPSLFLLLYSFWVTHGVPILLPGPGKFGSKEALINDGKQICCAKFGLLQDGGEGQMSLPLSFLGNAWCYFSGQWAEDGRAGLSQIPFLEDVP